jgi:hypothetical protein
LLPSQMAAVGATVGVAGIALMVTADVVAAALVQPFTVAVTLYAPLASVVGLLITGFCKLVL